MHRLHFCKLLDIQWISNTEKLEVDILLTLLCSRHGMKYFRMNESMKEFYDKVVKCSSNNAHNTELYMMIISRFKNRDLSYVKVLGMLLCYIRLACTCILQESKNFYSILFRLSWRSRKCWQDWMWNVHFKFFLFGICKKQLSEHNELSTIRSSIDVSIKTQSFMRNFQCSINSLI